MNLKVSILNALIVLVSTFGLAGAQTTAAAADQPTPVKRGHLTAAQKAHSKLYGRDSAPRKKLTSFTEPEITVTVYNEYPSGFGFDPRTLEDKISQRTCEADVVVVGSLQSSRSQLTVDEDFIFTDYKLAVSDVLKNDAGRSLSSSSIVVVSRPGGSVTFDGKIVTLRAGSERAFTKEGKYLLFLKRIPGSDGFTLTAGSVSVGDGERATGRLSDTPGFGDLAYLTADSIMDRIRAHGYNSCPRKN